MYVHHVLDARFPAWREHYIGEFPLAWGTAVALVASARCVIDLTTITGDGGGSQYTFMEAWDACTPLVVNRKWLVDPRTDEIRDGVNAHCVETPAELAAVLRGDVSLAHLVAGGTAQLALHHPREVAAAYAGLWR
jgi:hypothetical protein